MLKTAHLLCLDDVGANIKLITQTFAISANCAQFICSGIVFFGCARRRCFVQEASGKIAVHINPLARTRIDPLERLP